MLVRQAQEVFFEPRLEKAPRRNDGYVSFELDPLLEDPGSSMPHGGTLSAYIALGKKWSAGHQNRMIKVPATPAGLGALEELCAAGVTLNVTLIFTPRQYAIRPLRNWRGTAVRLGNERCHTPKTPPLPWGEGGGEGVRTIGVAMSRLIESAHPLTLVPLPMGEGTGCDLNVLFSSALPRDGAVMLLSQRCSNRGVAKAVVPESPSLPAQKSRGHERASAHASWAPSPEDRAPAPNQPAVV